ncbi:MAG TPA: hypothetical protein VGK23_01305 [Methanomassiliicoccales archaeon]|jgi:hypothetical protein
MTEKKECHRCGDQLEFPINETATLSVGGKDVGISCLDDVMNEVLSLNIDNDAEIKDQLLNRVKERDYVPPMAEKEYSEALLTEYKKRI